MIIVQELITVDRKIYLIFTAVVLLIVYSQYVSADNLNYVSDWLSPSANQLISYLPGVNPIGQDRTTGLFYSVAQWELDTCSQSVTSDKHLQSSPGVTSTDVSFALYAPITGTLQSKKVIYNSTDILYEASWYIHPETSSIQYDIYLVKRDGKTKYFIKQSATSDPMQGDVGYYVNYLTDNYYTAVIDYGTGTLETIIPEENS